MKLARLMGMTAAMTACSTNPPAQSGDPDIGTDRKTVKPSPIDFPAEIDPPPPVEPGSESPGVEPPKADPRD